MSKELGNPPLMFFDLRPVSYPMVVVNSHEVAEQISRSSANLPWSTPKSPTLGAFVRVTGPESILLKEVRCFPELGDLAHGRHPLADHGHRSGRIGNRLGNDSTRGLRPSIS
jgi:hypothetical protein